ncbi:multiubiquitin domain-containing protein [Pseudoalteromonas sp. JC3]|uniref:multiubiquitin domain-containing protein n=1 Tax=Pseudoalteromonas sp. JC3 TaxID=2810196 RepID=UPI0019D30CFE|nr:multiubiquitin domain-containing protein [Pseudoalteromonas sp. JC3]MBR8842859.1 multiubiquitin domain-containing protein [Pseudoalteromonas sp. JC3]WJE09249.1 multiubiquitin domain-containing protein [Pseudoalteromonas sp. JC3]
MTNIRLESGLYKGVKIYELLSVVEGEQLYLEQEGEIDIPVSKNDLVLIKGTEKFVSGNSNLPNNHKLLRPISFSINGEERGNLDRAKLSGQQIKDDIQLGNVALYLTLDNMPDYLLGDEEQLIISHEIAFLAVEKLESDDSAPDLEDCACNPCGPGHKQKYKIKVDKDKFVVNAPRLFGKEILALAGYSNTTERALYQKFAGGRTEMIKPEDKVDFTTPGIERFMTIPCEQTEGLQNTRRQFQLSENDTTYLDSLGLSWETVIERNIKRVVIYDYPIIKGYSVDKTDVYFQIPPSYPMTQIDMAYFYPSLQRLDGKQINCTTQDNFDGKTWQRWSRHRTSSNPWRPGLDSIETHIAYMNSWFIKEFSKR